MDTGFRPGTTPSYIHPEDLRLKMKGHRLSDLSRPTIFGMVRGNTLKFLSMGNRVTLSGMHSPTWECDNRDPIRKAEGTQTAVRKEGQVKSTPDDCVGGGSHSREELDHSDLAKNWAKWIKI